MTSVALDRPPSHQRALLLVGGGVLELLAFAIGSSVVHAPTRAIALALVIGLLAGVAVAARQPWVVGAVGIFFAVAPAPAALPYSVGVGPKQIFFSDILLPLALLLLLGRRSLAPRFDVVAWCLLTVVAVMTAWGAYQGNPFSNIVQDTRGPLYFAIVCLWATRYYTFRRSVTFVRLFAAILWATAVGMVFTASTHIAVFGGRITTVVQQKTAVNQAVAFDATRFLLNPKSLATIGLVTALVCLVAERGRAARTYRRWGALVAPPSFVISFLTFSRSTLLGVGTAVLLVLIVVPLRGLGARRIAALVMGVALIFLSVALGVRAPALNDPNGNLIARNVAGFQGRVIGGLSTEAATSSDGNLWRLKEAAFARTAIVASPVLGHGMGFAYRPDLTARGVGGIFANNPDFGTRFVHDAYLFYLIKIGCVGLGLLLVLLLWPVLTTVLTSHPAEAPEVGVALGVFAVMVVSFFFPDLQAFNSAPTLAVFVGWLAVLQHQRQVGTRARPDGTLVEDVHD